MIKSDIYFVFVCFASNQFTRDTPNSYNCSENNGDAQNSTIARRTLLAMWCYFNQCYDCSQSFYISTHCERQTNFTFIFLFRRLVLWCNVILNLLRPSSIHTFSTQRNQTYSSFARSQTVPFFS